MFGQTQDALRFRTAYDKDDAMIRTLAASAALLGAAFLAGTGIAPSSVAHAQTDYATVQADPALWKIETGDATVWLFGTYHILPPALEWRTDAVDGAFAESDTIWFEADVLSPEAQQTVAGLIPQLGLNPPGVALSSLLDDEANALLAQIAPTVGAAPAALEPMQPWLAALMLAVSQIQALGYDPAAGVEAVLNAQGQADGKDFDYFETAEQQLGFFAGLSTEEQVEWLVQTLREMEEMPAQINEMTVAWATGDTDTLDDMVNGAIREQSPELYDAIIVDRNRAWIPQIVEMIEQGGAHFVAVGAGHLAGEDSVVELLRAEGYDAVRQ